MRVGKRTLLMLIMSGLILAVGCTKDNADIMVNSVIQVAEDGLQNIEENETDLAQNMEDQTEDIEENASTETEEELEATNTETQGNGGNQVATGNTNTGNRNTSASSNPTTTPAPSTAQTTATTTTAHTHTWQTVHHEEVGHYESVLVQEEFRNPIYTAHTVCTHCGHDYTVNGEIPGPGVHTCEDGTIGAGYGSKRTYDHDQVFPAVYEDRWVVDTPAYDEQVCSTCGQKK